jgi:hypothetical protein
LKQCLPISVLCAHAAHNLQWRRMQMRAAR